MSTVAKLNRPLTPSERRLASAMLAYAEMPSEYLRQLENAQVKPWRCHCGCASIEFEIVGRPNPKLGIESLADFVFDHGEGSNGIFIYASGGVLTGIEVYAGDAEASNTLPQPESLRRIEWKSDGHGVVK